MQLYLLRMKPKEPSLKCKLSFPIFPCFRAEAREIGLDDEKGRRGVKKKKKVLGRTKSEKENK